MKQITAEQTKTLPEGTIVELRPFEGEAVSLIVTGDKKILKTRSGKTIPRSDSSGEFFIQDARETGGTYGQTTKAGREERPRACHIHC